MLRRGPVRAAGGVGTRGSRIGWTLAATLPVLALATSAAPAVGAPALAGRASAGSAPPSAVRVATSAKRVADTTGDAGQRTAGPRVTGGRRVPTTVAPYTVQIAVEPASSDDGWTCTGALVAPDLVVTAAHCVVDDRGVRVGRGAVAVVAGASDASPPLPLTAQPRGVAEIRVHPVYDPRRDADAAGNERGGDVATLRLDTAVDVGGPAVGMIDIAPELARPAYGQRVTAYGYGQHRVGVVPDGRLRTTSGPLRDPFGRRTCGYGNESVVLCAVADDGSVCAGDSGGPLVLEGVRPVLLGVLSYGPTGCARGDVNVYTDLTAPENRRFVLGEDRPPRAPRGGIRATALSGGPVRVGRPLRCRSAGWRNAPELTFRFTVGSPPRDLAVGARTYTPRQEDIGRPITCRIRAVNAGGAVEIRPPAMSWADPTVRRIEPVRREVRVALRDGGVANRILVTVDRIDARGGTSPVARGQLRSRRDEPVGLPVRLRSGVRYRVRVTAVRTEDGARVVRTSTVRGR